MKLTKTVQGHFYNWYSPSHYAYLTKDIKNDGVHIDTTEYPYLMDRAELEICGSLYNIDDWYLRVQGKYRSEVNLIIPEEIVFLDENGNEIIVLEKVPTQEDVPKSANEYFELSKKTFYDEKLRQEIRVIDGIKFINYAIKLEPRNEDAWLLKGKILKDATRFPNNSKKALRCFEKVIKLNPYNENALMESIKTHNRLGTICKHIEICNKVLEINPNNFEAWYWKGIILINEKQYKKAIDAIDKAIEKNSIFIDAWLNKGYVLALMGKFQEAFKCLDIAENLISPNDEVDLITIWYFRGKVYREMGEYNKAVECQDKCLECQDKCLGSFFNNIYRIEKAKTIEDKGDFSKALEVYDEILLDEDRTDFFTTMDEFLTKDHFWDIYSEDISRCYTKAKVDYHELNKLIENAMNDKDYKNALRYINRMIFMRNTQEDKRKKADIIGTIEKSKDDTCTCSVGTC